MAENTLQPGQVLEGRYRILRLKARGGMSEIYEAVHVQTDEIVIIKCLPQRLAHRPDLVSRFKHECRIYAQLKHPNIVRQQDAGTLDDGSLYIVMEKLDGESLRALLRKATRLHPLQALDILHAICEALRFAHAKDIWHRDIKPENVMVGEAGHVWVLDFGLARWNRPEGLVSEEMPAMGTAGYMAPEQAQTRSGLDHRADIYAAGVTAYEMIGGFNPFDPHEEATQVEVLAAHRQVEPQPLHLLDPDVPESVSRIVARCIAKNPADRFQTVEELWAEVRAELRRMIESGDPLAEFFRKPSEPLPSRRLQAAPGAARVMEAAPPPAQAAPQSHATAPLPGFGAEGALVATRSPIVQLEGQATAPLPERQMTVELPLGVAATRPALPFQPAAGAAERQVTVELPPDFVPGTRALPFQQAPPVQAATRRKQFAEWTLPAAAQATRSTPRPVSTTASLALDLPVPAQAVPSTPPPSSRSASTSPRMPAPSATPSTWDIHPREGMQEKAAPRPASALASGGLPRRLPLLAPAIGLVVALGLAAWLRSKREQPGASSTPSVEPIAAPAAAMTATTTATATEEPAPIASTPSPVVVASASPSGVASASPNGPTESRAPRSAPSSRPAPEATEIFGAPLQLEAPSKPKLSRTGAGAPSKAPPKPPPGGATFLKKKKPVRDIF